MSGKQKCFLTPGKNTFCFPSNKFVSATHVSRAAKLENICIRNNVSVKMFPSLARPLGLGSHTSNTQELASHRLSTSLHTHE